MGAQRARIVGVERCARTRTLCGIKTREHRRKAKAMRQDAVAARRGSPKGDHDVVRPVRDVQDRPKGRALTPCRGAAKDLRAKIFAVMRRLTPENRVPAVMSDRGFRKRLEGRGWAGAITVRGSWPVMCRGRSSKDDRALHIRKRLLKGRRRRHPNAIRSKEDRGSSSDEGRRNAIVIVIRRDGRKAGPLFRRKRDT